ncbi:adhesion G-protein coupled receptor F1-like isoform X2 [Ambystoma mexicanum]|uniref:adhesion G-protein coupled receptor F1-like isoform X2 n=1 Tax=Ambystoma mexicanum TaxID=8296 RepID=UPI0037E910D2
MTSLCIYHWFMVFLKLNYFIGSANVNGKLYLQKSGALETNENHISPRRKRDDASVQAYVLEYEVDIDVTLYNESRMNEIKRFLRTLNNHPLSTIDGTMNITSVDITMVCKDVGRKMSCTCERGYAWPSSMCNQYLPCTVLPETSVCNCIENMPNDLTGNNCAKPKNTLYGTCRVNQNFTNDFLNSSATMYKNIVQDFERALFKAYAKIEGFFFIRISHIRKGSIIVGFEISGDDISLPEVKTANLKVVMALRPKYGVEEDSFNVTDKEVDCRDVSSGYGFGSEEEWTQILCNDGLEGIIDAKCKNGKWHIVHEDCVYPDLLRFQEAINASFIQEHLPLIMQQLSGLVVNRSITTTAGNLGTIVHILGNISTIAAEANISSSTLQNFIQTVNYILHINTMHNWTVLLENEKDASSQLLQSVEKFARRLPPHHLPFHIELDFIAMHAIKVTDSNSQMDFKVTFDKDGFNATAAAFIPKGQIQKLPNDSSIVSIAYPTLGRILPKHSNKIALVNSLVISVVVKEHMLINDISLTFEKLNNSLMQPNCVFWDFNGTAWNSDGCFPENETDQDVVCRCSHLTSFSMLMSTTTPSDVILSYIANIGLSISIGSLFLGLAVEALVWPHVTKQRTAFMRHVCIVNIATSLLLADIWFIVAAINLEWTQRNGGRNNGKQACISATFFIHFFYMSLFFWMLTLGLLIFYRTIFIFHELGKQRLMCMAFSLGYGCPLIISVITLASTEPAQAYTRKDACWLNWDDSKALLAFVLPALIVVFLNFIILVLVIIKVQRPRIGEAVPEEKNIILQTGKRIAILSPILGLTWATGFAIVATGTPYLALHIIFSILNSLQGLFILTFVVLWDRKVQNSLSKTFYSSIWTSQNTKSTSHIPPGVQVHKTFNPFHKREKYSTAAAELSSSKQS